MDAILPYYVEKSVESALEYNQENIERFSRVFQC